MYCPGLPLRLLSPQILCIEKENLHQQKGCRYEVTATEAKLHLGGARTITVCYDPQTKLPRLACFENASATAEQLAMVCVTDEKNQNLTHLQKMLLHGTSS